MCCVLYNCFKIKQCIIVREREHPCVSDLENTGGVDRLWDLHGGGGHVRRREGRALRQIKRPEQSWAVGRPERQSGRPSTRQPGHWKLFTAQINTKATPEADKNAVVSQWQTMLRLAMCFIRFAHFKETFATISLGLPLGLQNVFNKCAFRNNENWPSGDIMKRLRVENFLWICLIK